MEERLDIYVGLSCVVPSSVGQTNAHRQYQQKFEDTAEFATPVSIANRESMMDKMWEARRSAFKVVEERWKTHEVDGEMCLSQGSVAFLTGKETLWKISGRWRTLSPQTRSMQIFKKSSRWISRTTRM